MSDWVILDNGDLGPVQVRIDDTPLSLELRRLRERSRRIWEARESNRRARERWVAMTREEREEWRYQRRVIWGNTTYVPAIGDL